MCTSYVFCFKCMLYGLPFGNNGYNNKGCIRSEKSGRANTLIFKNAGQKLKKLNFCIVYLLFPQLGKVSAPVTYGCYDTDN